MVFTDPPEPYESLGYLFDSKIMYIGDASSIPDETWSLIRTRCQLPSVLSKEWETANSSPLSNWGPKPPLQLLVIDCDNIEHPPTYFPSHLSLDSVVSISKKLGARRTYLVSSPFILH